METTVKTSAEEVLARAQRFFQKDWQHGGTISHPIPHTIQVETTRSGFPQSALGWIFNLALTVLTLGSWLLVWIVWIMWKAGETVDLVKVSAYPEGGETRVDVESTDGVWRADVEAWLATLT